MKTAMKTLSLLVGVALGAGAAGSALAQGQLEKVMKDRGLTEKDVLAAAKTYTPTGGRDEYLAFSSGGQSGQVIVYGVPSMRILKYIGVFTPEPWQGYGFDDESKAVLDQGRVRGKDLTFGDTHHPAISETNGDYDGQYLFINDKANPRVAVIDLHDFETKQIVVNPVFKSQHGGAFVTPNTEYVITAAQYAAPYEDGFVPLEEFNDKYRGGITYWKFNRETGRLVPEESFIVEAPPYSQDLSDAGKGPSDGWSFTNSFCSERYVGGIERGRPPFEAGCSAKDTDFLHVVNWKKAEELFKAGKTVKVNGANILPIDLAVKEGVLFLIPEVKSPHGVDVSPDGKYMIVSGKLDTHATVYSFEKIQEAIKAGRFEGKDPYGIPIIAMKDAIARQVELGLGPLHTQYDSKPCVAYTSLYVDSMVAKWDYCEGKVLDKISIHYNIGHLMTMEGDTVSPDGKYLVALNKLAIDRFNPVGPLHPQNHQLIDISGDKMELLYDMPLPLGEPHYVVSIKADKLKPAVRYKSGWNSRTDQRSEFKTRAGREKTERNCDASGNCTTEVWGTVIRSHITPGNHRGARGRYGQDPPDQPGTCGRRGARFRHVWSERPAVDRAGQDRICHLRGRPAGCIPVLLHRVLLGAAPGDAGLPAGSAQGLQGKRDQDGRGRGLYPGGLRQAGQDQRRYPGGHRLGCCLHHQPQLPGLPDCSRPGGGCDRPARLCQGCQGEIRGSGGQAGLAKRNAVGQPVVAVSGQDCGPRSAGQDLPGTEWRKKGQMTGTRRPG